MLYDERPLPSPLGSDDQQDEFIEPNALAFVVHIWLENTIEGDEPLVWRGRITHVASSQRHYLTDLSSLSDFIAPYLYKMGVRPPLLWRLQQRLGLLKKH
jgi:hypothetical protein